MRNWRSDTAVLTALNVLFSGATFGDRSISFVPVTAARDSQGRLTSVTGSTPLRHFGATGGGRRINRTKRGKAVVVDAAARRSKRISRRVLSSSTTPAAQGDGGVGAPQVRPDDIAVLVNTNQQCRRCRRR